MARSAYLGSDLPEEQLRAPARPPVTAVPGNTDLQELPGSPELPPEAGAAGDPMSIILERAERYMGVTPDALSTMDDASLNKLMEDLLAGYPDDAELLGAIEAVRGGGELGGGGEVPPMPVDAGAGAPSASSDMQFNPDRPY